MHRPYGKRAAVAVCAMVMALGVVAPAQADREWTRANILAIADEAVRKSGHDPERMCVAFDYVNSAWFDYLEAHHCARGQQCDAATASDGTHYLEGPLKDKRYWAVRYTKVQLLDPEAEGFVVPTTDMLTIGSVWVFIDRASGDVLGSL